MPCGRECNRRSGVVLGMHLYSTKNRENESEALAMRHKLQWFIHLRAHGLRKGDEHPPTLLMGSSRVWIVVAVQPQQRRTMVHDTHSCSQHCLVLEQTSGS